MKNLKIENNTYEIVKVRKHENYTLYDVKIDNDIVTFSNFEIEENNYEIVENYSTFNNSQVRDEKGVIYTIEVV